MAGLVEIAASIMARSERSVETSAHNIANLATSGYKRRVEFTDAMADIAAGRSLRPTSATDFAPGKPIGTNSSSDLSIAGEGFFVVRSGETMLYTRLGQFSRDEEGRLVTAQGFALQARGGGDLVVKSADFKVEADGVVIEGGQPVARLALVDFENRAALIRGEGGTFSAPETEAVEVQAPSVRQGMLEASNVSTGDEMVVIMEALRRAESGQRIVNVYDDLMGRALSTFGQ